MTPLFGHILFFWVGSGRLWIIIVETICPGVYFPDLTQLFLAATLTLVPDGGREK